MTQSSIIHETDLSFVGGVSQQAPSLRRDNQVEEQYNCRNSLVDGCGKRPNSELGGWVDITPPAGATPERKERLKLLENYHTHDLERGDEYYKVAVTDAEVVVLDGRTGFEYPVAWDSLDVRRYLIRRNGRDYRDSYQLVSSFDRTWIVNKTVAVRHKPFEPERFDPLPTIARVVKVAVEANPWMGQGIKIGGRDRVNMYYEFTVEGVLAKFDTGRRITHKHVLSFLRDHIHDVTGWPAGVVHDEIHVTVPANETLEVSGEWVYQNTRRDNNIYDTNPDVIVSSERADTPIAASPEIPQALYFIKQGDFQAKYTLTIDGTPNVYQATHINADGSNRDEIATSYIVGQLVSVINGNNATHGATASAIGNTIVISKDDNSDFSVTYEDSMGSTFSGLVKKAVEGIDDLPAEAPEGFVTEIAGDLDIDADPYWVKFTNLDDEGNEASGRWVETVGPFVSTELVAETMPIVMDRRQGSGHVTANNPLGVYFHLSFSTWSKRTVGDLDTAPWPSFVSEIDGSDDIVTPRYIDSMFFHENRLCFTSGSKFVASENGEYENFFPTTVSVVVDSDPIDVDIETAGGQGITYAMSATNELLLFTSTRQIALRYDGALSLNTIRSEVVASNEMSASCPPISVGDMVLFTSTGSRYTQVHAMYADGNAETYKVNKLTAHIPRYLEGRVLKMAYSTVGDYLFVLARKDDGTLSNELYVCNLKLGEDRIEQNAWQKWSFVGSVLDMHARNGVLTVIFRYGATPATAVNIIDLENDYVYDELGHPIYLDLRQEVDSSYVNPYVSIVSAVDDEGVRRYFAGIPYTQSVKLSQLFVRAGQGNRTLNTGHTRVTKLMIHYHNTTNFAVKVKRGLSERVTKFGGRVIGSLRNLIGKVPVEHGTKHVGVLSRSDRVEITIENDTPYDAVIQTVDWEGEYTNRGSRL